jgi:hypothetical protein
MNELTDEEKSVLLAKAMGLMVEKKMTNPWVAWFGNEEDARYVDVIFYTDNEGYLRETCNFYDGHMEAAWQVLNWVGQWDQISQWTQYTQFWGWWDQHDVWLIEYPKAQHLWLDKILELAIEAGLVEKA